MSFRQKATYGLAVLVAATIYAQTRIDPAQVRNFMVSPIAALEISECVGAVAPKDGVKGSDCAGLLMIRVELVDGTVLGPWIASAVTPEQTKAPVTWKRVPLMNR